MLPPNVIFLKLKCTKLANSISAPDPAEGTYSAPAGTLAGFIGHTSKARKDGQGQRGKKSRGKERRKRREGKGEGGGLRHGCWGDGHPCPGEYPRIKIMSESHARLQLHVCSGYMICTALVNTHTHTHTHTHPHTHTHTAFEQLYY